jgi:dihydrofolate synthase / folylpolyglutamate synthase
MRYEEAVAELDARRETRILPGVSRILRIATLLDDPQLRYPTIHVTGTNGKGTAARVAGAVACAHGLTAGLYTSPHLLEVTERLAVCGQDITREEFAEEYAHLLPFLELVDDEADERVTYFETLTALAYLWFADRPVSLGVFEVGMGGTWDATNLVAGDVAVITPIALDHPELGSTVAEVAGEKSGIIKPGKVAVIREQDAEAMAVIEARAAEMGAELRVEFRDWELIEHLQALGGQALSVRGIHDTYDELFLPMFGEHAARNAAAALVACESLLGEALDVEATREVLADVRWPGRMEVVSRQPLLMLDGAHNPAAAEALAVALREFFAWDRAHLVISVSDGKNLDGILAELAPITDVAYVARNASLRAGAIAPVADRLSALDVPVGRFGSVAEALDAARAAAEPADLILVTGSLYTVADARRALGLPSGDA